MALLGLIQVHYQNWNKFVHEDISIGEESDEHRFLQRIKHYSTWFDELLYHLHVDCWLFKFVFFNVHVRLLHGDSFGNLIDLIIDSRVPLDQVLFALARDDPGTRIILQLEAMLEHRTLLQIFRRRVKHTYPGILKWNEIEVFVLLTLLVIE